MGLSYRWSLYTGLKIQGHPFNSDRTHKLTKNKKNMNQEEIRNILEANGCEDVVLFVNPDYASAFVGVSENDRAVYDFDKMVKHLMDVDDMTEEDAIEFIEYNTIRSLPYIENHPIVYRNIE